MTESDHANDCMDTSHGHGVSFCTLVTLLCGYSDSTEWLFNQRCMIVVNPSENVWHF